jgi:hypothetical protein
MSKKSTTVEIDSNDKAIAESQIREKQTDVDYQTKEFTVELLVQKYAEGEESGTNEIFVPLYQRAFVWTEARKSKFIESVILGLPIPYIFIASLNKPLEEDEGRAEIVDGSQRIRTLTEFLQNKLQLVNLKKIGTLNGFYFSDLELSRQRKFKRQPIRVIELSEKATEEIRRDLFERINTGSDELKSMEKRKGIYTGVFYDFVKKCADDIDFREICPLPKEKINREELQELVLRYFAYADEYLNFKHSVSGFLDDYLKKQNEKFNEKAKSTMEKEFIKMIQFVKSYFPNGFRKSSTNKSVPRVRFEAIAVGTTLAQRQKPKLIGNTETINAWLESKDFEKLVTSDASNSLPRLRNRIEYVRDKLLGN